MRSAGIAERLAVAPIECHLGRDQHLRAAAAGQCLADDLLGAAEAIDRRGIDQGYAAIQRLMDGADGCGLIGAAPHPAAHGPGSKCDAGSLYWEFADCDGFHFKSPRVLLLRNIKRATITTPRDIPPKPGRTPLSTGRTRIRWPVHFVVYRRF